MLSGSGEGGLSEGGVGVRGGSGIGRLEDIVAKGRDCVVCYLVMAVGKVLARSCVTLIGIALWKPNVKSWGRSRGMNG